MRPCYKRLVMKPQSCIYKLQDGKSRRPRLESKDLDGSEEIRRLEDFTLEIRVFIIVFITDIFKHAELHVHYMY